jgi:flagellar FliJ protein
MMPRKTSMRLNRRGDKSRKVEALQRIIREFDQMAADLELQIKIEDAAIQAMLSRFPLVK